MDENKPLSKIKLPKFNLKSMDWSKLNLRKFNWMTVLGILAYINVLVAIPLFAGRKSDFIRFHTRQGLALLIVWAFFLFTFYLPILPWIFFLFILLCVIWGIASVSTGRERPLPLIGRLAIK